MSLSQLCFTAVLLLLLLVACRKTPEKQSGGNQPVENIGKGVAIDLTRFTPDGGLTPEEKARQLAKFKTLKPADGESRYVLRNCRYWVNTGDGIMVEVKRPLIDPETGQWIVNPDIETLRKNGLLVEPDAAEPANESEGE